MSKVHANGITMEYDTFGCVDSESMLLIAGMGVQMTGWAVPFCELLAGRGFRVIRFDNRDSGLSSCLDDEAVPDFASIAAQMAQGEPPAVPYTLYHMAQDAVSLLDALAIECAHIVGMSMGGMIAQLVASEHPNRALSMVSIMSSSGNPNLPHASPEVIAMLTRRVPHPAEDEAGFVAHQLALARLIGSPGYPIDEDAQRLHALADARRAYHPQGIARQRIALATTGDFRSRLKNITAPTLVIHGAHDPLVLPAGGADTAANIQGAEFLIFDGMGHELPPALFHAIAAEIARNARRSVPREIP